MIKIRNCKVDESNSFVPIMPKCSVQYIVYLKYLGLGAAITSKDE